MRLSVLFEMIFIKNVPIKLDAVNTLKLKFGSVAARRGVRHYNKRDAAVYGVGENLTVSSRDFKIVKNG